MHLTVLQSICSNMFKKIFPQTRKYKHDFGKFSIVMPVSNAIAQQEVIRNNIKVPQYYKDGIPIPGPQIAEIKTHEQINRMRESCKLAANILKQAGKHIHVGLTTNDLNSFVHNLVLTKGAYPSPLNYRCFPKSICTSVNNVACHGIPDNRPLLDGDIVSVDITVFLNNYHGDCCKTFMVGNVDSKGRELIEATETCLMEAIEVCRPGQAFATIGELIERRSKQLGMTVVPAFVGHGIGTYFHGAPEIYHFRNDFPGKMVSGMTFTIEPVLSQGSGTVELLDDNWTAVTEDNSRAAQFEHTILITDNGYEILTISDD